MPYASRKCDRPGCNIDFIPTTHNKRYCNPECTRLETNKRILANYHKKKKNRGKKRTCSAKDCRVVLSKYNEGKLCGIHERQAFLRKLRRWGWNTSGME